MTLELLENNIILSTDSYKASHFLQYPPGTSNVFSYIEARGNGQRKVVFFGLQMYVKKYLSKPITKEHIDAAEAIIKAHGEPFNRAGWEYIVEKYGGYIPVTIKAVKEGRQVPTGNVLVTVQCTENDPNIAWVVNYIETGLMRSVWYPTTVATVSRQIYELIYGFLRQTSEDPDGVVKFKLHDFGARGVSSKESAAIGGLAHLVNFFGTDTLEAIVQAKMYYNENMAGFSIPAAEHSTITSWGRAHEADAYRNMVNQFKAGGIVAVVSDSYDIFNACSKVWGEELKDEVINSGATVVVRPDSGDPVTVVQRCVDILGEKFGYTTNAKGYKVLHPSIRVIQGDGVNYDSIYDILASLKRNGWSAENVAFGMGGALLQHPNRDTYSFAMKCAAIRKDGLWLDVSKDPVTDMRKRSKAGRISLYEDKNTGELKTERTEFVDQVGRYANYSEVLVPVYQNGRILKEYTLSEVRQNVNI